MRTARAGLCKDIRVAHLRNTSKAGKRDGGRVPTLASSRVPLPSDLERHRRERNHEQDERHPCEHTPGSRQRPLCIEHRWMAEAATRQDEHEQSPVQPSPPEPTEYDDENPEAECNALLPAGKRGIQDVPAVELGNGE